MLKWAPLEKVGLMFLKYILQILLFLWLYFLSISHAPLLTLMDGIGPSPHWHHPISQGRRQTLGERRVTQTQNQVVDRVSACLVLDFRRFPSAQRVCSIITYSSAPMSLHGLSRKWGVSTADCLKVAVLASFYARVRQLQISCLCNHYEFKSPLITGRMVRLIEHLLGVYRSIGLAYLLFVYSANSFGLPHALSGVKLREFPKVQFILWQEIYEISALSKRIVW